MLVSDFISTTGPVRPTLQDAAANRWSDATLIGFLTDFVRLVQGRFPVVRRNAQGGIDAVLASALTSGQTIPLSDDWLTPWAAEYVLYRAFGSDAKDEGNRAQAGNHLAALKVVLPGFGG